MGRASLNVQGSKAYLKKGKRYKQMTSAVAIHAGACLVAFLTIGAGGAHTPTDVSVDAHSRPAPVKPVVAPVAPVVAPATAPTTPARPVSQSSRDNARN